MTQPENRPAIISWCLYDWANSAFNTVIGTFIFSVYFAKAVYGDATEGSVVWGYAIGGAGLSVALLGPVLGAIADRSGRRKPWIAGFTGVTVIASAALFYIRPDPEFVVVALALVVIGSIAFEFCLVFYNATLHAIAPETMLGRISGWGWAVGYIGGLGCLGVALIGLVQPEEPWFGLSKEMSENIRATGPLVALWFGIFSVPFFIFMPDGDPSRQPVTRIISEGLRQLRTTIGGIKNHRPIVIFLIASALYRDGLVTLFALGGLYAAGVYNMDFQEILVFAIALNVSAGMGAFGFSWLDDNIGSKETILFALCGLVGFGLAALFAESKFVFIALAIGLGIFVGPAQAASRTFMARLSPKGMETEMFGLYALSGKSVAFIGPILYAAATSAFGTQRAGLATILLAWISGGLLLTLVREIPRNAASNAGNGASR
jgi:UMF1 family MFS transporter